MSKRTAAIIVILIIFCNITVSATKGYIYDTSTNDRISGAVVTCEVWDGEKWKPWDADEWEQNNPMRSDRNGNYGWLVSRGKYRITVKADGYTETVSEEVEFPPGHTGLNIGLTPIENKQTKLAPTDNVHGGFVLLWVMMYHILK